MPKRFTDTEKWEDPWYRKLSPPAKLLFNYLCDRCDLAGFWEIDVEMAAFKTGHPLETIQGALEEVRRCYETNGTYLWIVRFIAFQGNYPFKEKNRACLKIINLLKHRESFSENITRLLNGEGLPSSFGGGNKDLLTPASQGQGISKGQGQGISKALNKTKIETKTKTSKSIVQKPDEKIYNSAKGKILKGKILECFEAFLVAFGSRAGKAAAADSWLKLNPMSDDLFAEIITGAKRYDDLRVSIGQKGNVPKMAQGWLTDRRWEDPVERPTHGKTGQLINQRSLGEYTGEET